MNRATYYFLWLTVIASTSPIGAQVPATTSLYGEIIAETRATGDAIVVADLDAALLETSSGRRWLRARRPELYESLTRPTGREQTTRSVRFGEQR